MGTPPPARSTGKRWFVSPRWGSAQPAGSAGLRPVGLALGYEVNGVEVVAEQPQTEPYVEYQEFRDRYDAKHHSLLTPQLAEEQPVKKFIKLPGKVFTDADDTTPGYLNDELIVESPRPVPGLERHPGG